MQTKISKGMGRNIWANMINPYIKAIAQASLDIAEAGLIPRTDFVHNDDGSVTVITEVDVDKTWELQNAKNA